MKHTVAGQTARYGAARSQLSFGMFALLTWLVGNHVVGCGDSDSSTPSTSTNSNTPGGQNNGSSAANGSGTGAGSTPSATPGGESTPGNIALDPNRDQSEPINLVASGAVQCGGAGNYCVAPSGTCCITGGGGMMGGGNMGGGNAFSCAASPDACPAGTTLRQECSSQASCGGGEVCCRTGGGGGMGGGGLGGGGNTSCESACAMGSVQVCLQDAECGAGNQCNGNGTCGPIPCTSTSCGDGQVCCRGQGGGAQNQCAAPDAAGACPNNQRKVCATAADCPADFTCSPAGGFGGGGGGVLVCTPPACTLTSCGEGQVCCVGGQVGGTPACSAASDTGACPGNSRLLCETDENCAAAPGTLCLPPPNGGMGAISCRVPPPPPGDAGVGDAG